VIFLGAKISQPSDKKDGLATKYKGFFFSWQKMPAQKMSS
jgi:hypothetical protein